VRSEKLQDGKTASCAGSCKRIVLFLFTFHVSLFICPDIAVSDEDTPDNRLELFLDGLATFSAGFEQRLFNEYHVQQESSTGVMYLQRPGKFHWNYEEPYSQQLISNGEILWIYDADLEQVTISDIANVIAETPAAILSGNTDIEEKFIVNELEKTDSIHWIELTPKAAESQFESIRFGFRDQELAAMVLFDNLGQITEITFKDSRRNPDLDDSLFRFTVPGDVDVIDNRERQAPDL